MSCRHTRFSHRGRAQTPAWRVPSVSVRAHRTARNALQPRERWRPMPWRREGKTYEEPPNVCINTPTHRQDLCQNARLSHWDDEEVLGVTGTEKHQPQCFFSVLLTEESTSCFLENAGGGIIFAQTAHSVSRCQSWDHARQTPWSFGGRRTGAILVILPGARQMRPISSCNPADLHVRCSSSIIAPEHAARDSWYRWAELRDYMCVWPYQRSVWGCCSMWAFISPVQSSGRIGTDKISLSFSTPVTLFKMHKNSTNKFTLSTKMLQHIPSSSWLRNCIPLQGKTRTVPGNTSQSVCF